MRALRDATEHCELSRDARYELTEVKTNGTVAEQYDYDAAGRRVRIVQPGAGITQTMVYDGVQVVADHENGVLARTYTWGPGIDNLLAMTVHGAATNVYYALKDHLGSIVAMADTNGAVVESYAYDAWGVVTAYNATGGVLSASALGNRYLFQGREYSWLTGLYHFRARWYDPATARWLSKDPIGISGGRNLYLFCGGDGVNMIDPMGLTDGPADLYDNDFYDPAPRGVRSIGDSHSARPQAVNPVLHSGAQKAETALEVAVVAGTVAISVVQPEVGVGAAGNLLVRVGGKIAGWFRSLFRSRNAAKLCDEAAENASKVFSKEKQALVDMAKADKRTGMTKADMEAYKELNKQLPDPFPVNKVRGPEAHPSRSPHSQQPHGHVGPVDHIPITDAN